MRYKKARKQFKHLYGIGRWLKYYKEKRTCRNKIEMMYD